MTMLEVTVAMSIVMLALTILGTTIASASRTRAVNREQALAAREARNLLERINEQDFFDLFALYNEDPNDDPDGAGTAPGNLFDVRGLDPLAGAGAVGSVHFPSSAPAAAPTLWQLREDVEDRNLARMRHQPD